MDQIMDDPVLVVMMGIQAAMLIFILLVHIGRWVSKYLDDRHWEKECKKFLLTEEDLQQMRDRRRDSERQGMLFREEE